MSGQNPLQGWSKDHQDLLRDFIRAFAGPQPTYTGLHPVCQGAVATVNLCWKHNNGNAGRFQVVCKQHRPGHIHFLTEPLSRIELQSIVNLRSVIQRRSAPGPIPLRLPTVRTSQSNSSLRSNSSTSRQHIRSSSPLPPSSPFVSDSEDEDNVFPQASSSSSMQSNFLSIPRRQKSAKAAILRIVLFLDHNKPPVGVELPWPSTAEYFAMIDHIETLSARLDVRQQTSVKQYKGALTKTTVTALSKGKATPSLFIDDDSWAAAIYLGDLMVLERPSSECIVLARPSVLAVLMTRNTINNPFDVTATPSKGKRKASDTLMSARPAKH
ncbi:hypothetical protein PENSPDRAFT_740533 [Peniophora sp. CONT]|nr:hypothetical protein PENSPDRAFT_740533 [Peniophora sp. CONT]